MKFPKKQELRAIQNVEVLKMYCKPIFFLVIHTTFASYNPLLFRKNLLEKYKN